MNDSTCRDCPCYVTEHVKKTGYCGKTGECVDDIKVCPLEEKGDK
jgi:hypothetical protein